MADSAHLPPTGSRPAGLVGAVDLRRIAGVLTLIAASLGVMAGLHLSGALDGGSRPYSPGDAGIAEAVIGVVLLAAAMRLRSDGRRGIPLALGAAGFAIAGFLIGLTITAQSGSAVDIAYHSAVLPVLATSFALLWRARRRAGPH